MDRDLAAVPRFGLVAVTAFDKDPVAAEFDIKGMQVPTLAGPHSRKCQHRQNRSSAIVCQLEKVINLFQVGAAASLWSWAFELCISERIFEDELTLAAPFQKAF